MAAFISVASLCVMPYLSAQDGADDIIELSPFEVDASQDRGYRATSTLGGTRINTQLRDVGSAISVVTKEFIEDIGATGNETLLQYTTSTETGGVGGNFGGDEGTNLLRPNTNNRVRGLQAADNTRDFFLTDLPWDSYNVERVDMQRGPNAILFGLGSPAGIINNTTTGATFKNSAEFKHRYGSYSSQRASFNINRVIVEDQLAVRVAGVSDHERFRQSGSYEVDDRGFVAVKYDPKWSNSDGARTTITANYEWGNTNSNRPRSRPPEDRLTPWWNSYTTPGGHTFPAQLTADPFFANNGILQNQMLSEAVPAPLDENPYWGEFFTAGPVLYFERDGTLPFYASVPTEHESDLWTIDENGNVETANSTDQPFYRGQAQIERFGQTARDLGLPLAQYGGYQSKALTDRSIFDYKNHLLDGPNKREWRDFEVYNIKIAQTFMEDRFGIEAAIDEQDYIDGQTSPFGWQQAITVDLNEVYPDGSPNPNVGRPYILNRANFSNNSTERNRESSRVTAFAKVDANDFMDGDSFLGKLLGQHNFTAMASRDEVEFAQESWKKWVPSNEYAQFIGETTIASNVRETAIAAYMGPDLRGVSNPTGLNLQPINALYVPDVNFIRTWDSHWNGGSVLPSDPWVNPWNGNDGVQANNPDNYIGWVNTPATILSDERGDRDHIRTLARKNKQKIESEAFVWQGYLWNGAIVPTYGYRQDTSDSFGVDAPVTNDPYRVPDPSSPLYVYPATPGNSVAGESDSWSVVVHTERLLPQDFLPGNARLSFFYNESSNFEPSANRVDHLNRPLGPPSGETTDYGFVVEAFNGKVIFKMNKFETSAKDASFNPGNLWMLGTMETSLFVAAKRDEASLNNLEGYADDWRDYRNNPWPGQTPDEAEQYQREVVAAGLANIAGDEFWNAWGATKSDERWQSSWWDPWSGTDPGAVPANFTSTTDRLAEGTEYEINIQPTDNWDIAINAAEVETINTNLSGSLREWVDARNEVFNGRAGDLRYWWSGDTFTLGDRWNRDFYSGYQLAIQKEGTQVDELREWRFNATTSYRFTDGILKGFDVGGSVRWEDEVGIGYPQSEFTDENGNTIAVFDINNPWMAPSETHVDLFARYNMKLRDNIDWNIQLNVRDVTADGELIAVNSQIDGSPAFFRIGADTTWYLTNTFKF